MENKNQKHKEDLLNLINQLQKEVTCPICLEFYTDPISLPDCNHAFCKNCFTKLISVSTKQNCVDCPLCKKPVSRRNYENDYKLPENVKVVRKYQTILLKQPIEPKKLHTPKRSRTPKTSKTSAKKRKSAKKPLTIKRNTNLKKAKSLDCIKEEDTKEPRPKRYSLGSQEQAITSEQLSELFATQNIRDYFVNDRQVIELMEQDCLANLEQAFQNQASTSKKQTNEQNLSSDKGWKRMKSTKKCLNKNEKKLKQLDISTFSTKSPKTPLVKSLRSTEKQKTKTTSPKSEILTPDLQKNHPTFKLDHFENYLQENLAPIGQLEYIDEVSSPKVESRSSRKRGRAPETPGTKTDKNGSKTSLEPLSKDKNSEKVARKSPRLSNPSKIDQDLSKLEETSNKMDSKMATTKKNDNENNSEKVIFDPKKSCKVYKNTKLKAEIKNSELKIEESIPNKMAVEKVDEKIETMEKVDNVNLGNKNVTKGPRSHRKSKNTNIKPKTPEDVSNIENPSVNKMAAEDQSLKSFVQDSFKSVKNSILCPKSSEKVFKNSEVPFKELIQSKNDKNLSKISVHKLSEVTNVDKSGLLSKNVIHGDLCPKPKVKSLKNSGVPTDCQETKNDKSLQKVLEIANVSESDISTSLSENETPKRESSATKRAPNGPGGNKRKNNLNRSLAIRRESKSKIGKTFSEIVNDLQVECGMVDSKKLPKNVKKEEKTTDITKGAPKVDKNVLNKVPESSTSQNDDVFDLPTQILNFEEAPLLITENPVCHNEVQNEIFDICTQRLSESLEIIEAPQTGEELPFPKPPFIYDSQTSAENSQNQNHEIVVEVDVHHCDNNELKKGAPRPQKTHFDEEMELEDTLSLGENIIVSTRSQSKSPNEATTQCQNQLALIQRDIVSKNNLANELSQFLLTSKSLFSPISQKLAPPKDLKQRPTIAPTEGAQSCPVLSADKETINFYNTAIPHLNKLRALYQDYDTLVFEMTQKVKELQEIYGHNSEPLNQLLNCERDKVDFCYQKITKTVPQMNSVALQTDFDLKCIKCQQNLDPKSTFQEPTANIIEKKVNRQLNFSPKDTENNYKRIRNHSGSDSESEYRKKIIRTEDNPFENDNLNVIFVSEPFSEDLKKVEGTPDLMEKYKNILEREFKGTQETKGPQEARGTIDIKEKPKNFAQKEPETTKLFLESEFKAHLEKSKTNLGQRGTQEVQRGTQGSQKGTKGFKNKDNASKHLENQGTKREGTQDITEKYKNILEREFKELKNQKTPEVLTNSFEKCFEAEMKMPFEVQKSLRSSKESQFSKSLFTENDNFNKTILYNAYRPLEVQKLNSQLENEFSKETQFTKSLFTETSNFNKASSPKKTTENLNVSISLFTEKLNSELNKTVCNIQSRDVLTSPKDLFDEKDLDNEVATHLTNTSFVEDSLDGSDGEKDFDKTDIIEGTPDKTVLKRKNDGTDANLDAFVAELNHNPQTELDILQNSEWLHNLAPPPEFQDSEKVAETSFEVINKNFKTPMSPEIFESPKTRNILNECVNLSEISTIDTNSQKENIPHSLRSKNSQNTMNKSIDPLSMLQNEQNTALTLVKSKSYVPKTISNTPKQTSIFNFIKTPTTSIRKGILTPKSIVSPKNIPNPNLDQILNEPMDITPIKLKSKIDICLACTRLKADENSKLLTMTERFNLSFSKQFTEKVTHLIVTVDDRNRIKDLTMKYVSAISNGIWIVSFLWVKKCLEHDRILPEEQYEVLDISGIPGPQKSRLTRKTKPLFKDFVFYCSEPFESVTKKDLETVLTNLGAEIVTNLTTLKKKGKISLVLTEYRSSQDFDIYQHWFLTMNIITVEIEWLSRSVGQYEVTSIRPFMLCEDNGTVNNNYPPYLLAVVPDSFTETENTMR